MKLRKIGETFGLSVLLGLMASPLSAADDTEGYNTHPKAKKFIARLSEKPEFERQQLEKLLSRAHKKQSIIDAMSRPAEKSKPWYDYRKIFLGKKRISKGVQFWLQHEETLNRASEEYGVPAEVIVAIIGVETHYGRITGNYRVIDALSTLAFDYPKRSKFFTKELEHFLHLSQEQQQDPLGLKGSYAGAMGYGQFMPSSYRSYAVDFDGDEIADIWNNPTDAIGSVANYFKRHGWKSGGEVVLEAVVAEGAPTDLSNQSLKPKYTLGSLAKAGFSNTSVFSPETPASLVKLELKSGDKYWLGLQNYYVITRYNHSRMYAMAVHQLSQKILKQYQQQDTNKTASATQ